MNSFNVRENAVILKIVKMSENLTDVAIFGPHYLGKLKIPTLAEFKQKIKSWNGNSCICSLCKVFIKDLWFLKVYLGQCKIGFKLAY